MVLVMNDGVVRTTHVLEVNCSYIQLLLSLLVFFCCLIGVLFWS